MTDICFISEDKYQPFTTNSKLLIPLENKASENIVEKGENAGNQHFLLFPQCFLPFPNYFSFTSILSSANAFNLDQSKILSYGNGLVQLAGWLY